MDLSARSVLVVDDEPSVREVAARMLNCLGFQAVTASNGDEAVSLFGEGRSRLSLVLLDHIMPNKNGEETYEELRRIDPGIPVVLMSGYSEEPATPRPGECGSPGFLPKPFTLSELEREVLRAVDP